MLDIFLRSVILFDRCSKVEMAMVFLFVRVFDALLVSGVDLARVGFLLEGVWGRVEDVRPVVLGLLAAEF